MSSRCLIVTDMDGTLLDHHDYDYSAVVPLMEKLERAGIPVILNTSKTYAELRSWIVKLNNQHPFIVENGSALYIPSDYFPAGRKTLLGEEMETKSDYLVITTGTKIEKLREFKRAQKPDALDLTECSHEEAIAVTGLSEEEVQEAQDREYSIPLQFTNPEKESRFAEAAVRAGFGILRGGRFLHQMGATDKGTSMLRLKRLYERVYDSDYRIIVLGDSPNDMKMLEAADIAVVVASPSSSNLQPANDALIRTERSAPEGWVEGVTKALSHLMIKL